MIIAGFPRYAIVRRLVSRARARESISRGAPRENITARALLQNVARALIQLNADASVCRARGTDYGIIAK